jgi:hypothetical protein
VTEEPPLSDIKLRDRTEALLKAAMDISLQLQLQTERLSAAIDSFDREIITPLRRELKDK